MTITVDRHYQFRPWMARITGTDPRFTFAREFLPSAARSSSRSGLTGEITYEVGEPGLFCIGGTKHENGYFIVWQKADGSLVRTKIAVDRAMKIVHLLDAGRQFEDARKDTK